MPHARARAHAVETSPDPVPVRTSPAPAPARRPPRLDAARVLALQRTAGNHAVAALLQRAPVVVPPELQMPETQSRAEADPLAEAGVTVPPQLQEKVLAELRGETRMNAAVSFSKYQEAAMEIKAAHEKADAAPGLLEKLIDLAVGALAPGLAGFALGPLRNVLKGYASKAIEDLAIGAENQVKAYVTADHVVDKLLSNEAGAENAWKAVKGVWKSTVQPTADVGAMLDGFVEDFSVYLGDLSHALSTMSAADQLGAWAMFDPAKASKHYYKRRVEDLLAETQDLVHAASDRSDSRLGGEQRIVLVEAYGRTAPAVVISGGGVAMFQHWVASDVADTARDLGKAQDKGKYQAKGLLVVAPKETFDPARHSERVVDLKPPWEGEQYAEVLHHGGSHLAKVTLDAAKQPTFVAWVGKDDEFYARAKGQEQFEGLLLLNDSELGGTLPPLPGEKSAPK